MYVIKGDVIKSAGSLQLCAGYKAGSEAAVHAMNKLFEEKETDAVLLVDASNAFNSLNHDVFLHSVQVLCPAMSTYWYGKSIAILFMDFQKAFDSIQYRIQFCLRSLQRVVFLESF